jgi:hypothetical protein
MNYAPIQIDIDAKELSIGSLAAHGLKPNMVYSLRFQFRNVYWNVGLCHKYSKLMRYFFKVKYY